MTEVLPADTTCIVGFGRAGQALGHALGRRPWVALDRGGGPRVAPWLEEVRHLPRRPARHVEVVAIGRGPDGFALSLADGGRLLVRRLVVATGATGRWEAPPDLAEGLRHLGSPDLALPSPGQQVLVVGSGPLPFRAVLRLWERGSRVALSLPGPAPLLSPRLAPSRPLGRALPHLPAWLGGWILRRELVDLRAWDWPRPFPDEMSVQHGPDVSSAVGLDGLLERARARGAVAFDEGLGQLVRQGAVIVYPPVARVAWPRVVFEDGREDRFDVGLVAPRPSPGLEALLSPELARSVLDADGQPRETGRLRDGLGFIGVRDPRAEPDPSHGREAAALAAALGR